MNKKELSNKINELLIFRNEDGSYFLFGKYRIIPDSLGNFQVSNDDEIIHNFSSLKNAVTWCVFDKNKQYKDVRRIVELDDMLGGIDVSIAQHKRLAEKSNCFEDRSIYLTKLYEEKLKKRSWTEEINTYIKISKHWQNKKFAENQA
jgi:hypothetical protein